MVEPHLADALKIRNHMLDDMFSVRKIKVEEKKTSGEDIEESVAADELIDSDGRHIVEKVGVFCDDSSQFVLNVMAHRGLDPQSCDVHCGFDGGQGMLKLAVTITDRQESEQSGRSLYSQGVAAKQAKNSSVKKLFLLGVVPDVPETHYNVQTILSNLNLSAIEFTTAADLKMYMLLTGKSLGKPKFGCPFCSACTPYLEDGELYYLKDLLALHKAYSEAGGIKRTQQKYQNVTNPPLLTADDSKLIIEVLCIPELHILIGVVDKLLKEFEKNVFPSEDLGLKFMDKYLKKVAIERKSYQGAHSLEGNQSRDFLKKVDILQQALEKESEAAVLNGLPFIHTFRAFSKVVSSCFGVSLQEDYQAQIFEFKRLYLALGISVTPKVIKLSTRFFTGIC